MRPLTSGIECVRGVCRIRARVSVNLTGLTPNLMYKSRSSSRDESDVSHQCLPILGYSTKISAFIIQVSLYRHYHYYCVLRFWTENESVTSDKGTTSHPRSIDGDRFRHTLIGPKPLIDCKMFIISGASMSRGANACFARRMYYYRVISKTQEAR